MATYVVFGDQVSTLALSVTSAPSIVVSWRQYGIWTAQSKNPYYVKLFRPPQCIDISNTLRDVHAIAVFYRRHCHWLLPSFTQVLPVGDVYPNMVIAR
jgi:hypothetical protein